MAPFPALSEPGWVKQSARTPQRSRPCCRAARASPPPPPGTAHLRLATTSAHVWGEHGPGTLPAAARVLQVATAAARVLALTLARTLAGGGNAAARAAYAADLRLLVTQQGPVWVKLGQTLSTRPDVIGAEAAEALQQLQDAVPPFSTAEAMSILEQELGAPPSALFSALSPQPVASASLGVVFRATLAADATEVAIKVQRPGMQGAILLDLHLLRLALAALRKVARINQDITRLADELAAGLLQELDYRQEGANSEAFWRAHRRLGFVVVPAVRWELTTHRVLTTEWVHGVGPAALLAEISSSAAAAAPAAAVADASAAAPTAPRTRLLALVDMGVQASLTQLLESGVLHADPHPGNVLLTPTGKLAYLDFALLCQVPSHARAAMLATLLHLAWGDWRRVAEDFKGLRILKPTTDLDQLAADLRLELQGASARGQRGPAPNAGGAGATLAAHGCSAQKAPAPLFADGAASIGFGRFSAAVFKLALKYRFELPPYYVLVVRSCALLEGIAIAADPQYKVVSAAAPIVARRLLGDRRAASRQLLGQALLDGRGGLQLERLRELLLLWASSQERAHAQLSLAPLVRVLLDGTRAAVVAAQLRSPQAAALRRAIGQALGWRLWQGLMLLHPMRTAFGGGSNDHADPPAGRSKWGRRQRWLLQQRALRWARGAWWQCVCLLAVLMWEGIFALTNV